MKDHPIIEKLERYGELEQQELYAVDALGNEVYYGDEIYTLNNEIYLIDELSQDAITILERHGAGMGVVERV